LSAFIEDINVLAKLKIPPARIWSARNAKYAHASDFVVMTCCYPSWRHSYRSLTHSLYGTRNAWCFRSACGSRMVCRSHQ